MNTKIKPEKQKAAELVLKYMSITGNRVLATQCAQMTCSEVINYTRSTVNNEFWKQVKKEVEKL